MMQSWLETTTLVILLRVIQTLDRKPTYSNFWSNIDWNIVGNGSYILVAMKIHIRLLRKSRQKKPRKTGAKRLLSMKSRVSISGV